MVASKVAAAAMVLAFAGGCASKGYVRNTVQTSNDQLAAKVDGDIKKVQSNVSELSDQVGANAAVTKEHTTQIASNATKITEADTKINAANSQIQAAQGEIRAVDTKAMTAVEGTRTAIGETGKRVDGLASQFDNRNNYAVSAENAVLFATNSAKLKPEFHTVLDGVAQKLKQDPNAVIVLEGRTDNTGDADYNIKLGQQRLDAVLRYLVIQSDVPIQRIYQLSLGKEKPVADNKTREGREQNRATVVKILTPTASGTVAAK